MPLVNACAKDPDPEVLHFFDQLTTQLALNTECKGVQVAKYDGPNSETSPATTNTMAKPHTTLIVDYLPGSPKHAWTLVGGSGTKHIYMEGEGDPQKIAASICTIVTERGARFVK